MNIKNFLEHIKRRYTQISLDSKSVLFCQSYDVWNIELCYEIVTLNWKNFKKKEVKSLEAKSFS